ncbi:hypothetical protein CEUSTIGMA_g11565.t1 [Chlamydomonas eustigma]|uniref:Acid ceramidase N-terminal domain-containing protein n=1 Tax=Chlamydomonas eustigma TaxID=1157962 RepID=A0A250XML8_9CHLO|nr:hypothetical protein CEUSTIGMA_g11565.t1 [Chlamydomonas eustigma]|eukprot:GAX84142.1 hypothetical protein CEUSTIGMA_g11565.t1 [Chlamydomonas eustigma]
MSIYPTYKTYVINLDLPPRQRWVHVIKDNLDVLEVLVSAYNQALIEEFGALAPLANLLSGMVYVPNVFKEEMRGLAEASDGRLSYALVLRLNIGYDFVAKCTSAGVRLNNMLYHLRNMDWDMNVLKKVTIILKFERGGRIVHQGISWVGFVGTYTQMSAAGYSISLNYRKVGVSDLLHIFSALVARTQSIGFVVRLLLEEGLPYEQFVSRLLSAKLIAPCYLTVVGINQAVVVTRGKRVEEECRNLEECRGGGAYVIQTNHDPWLAKVGGAYELTDNRWQAWAAGDELLLDTKERYACAMKGIKAVVSELSTRGSEALEQGGEEAAALSDSVKACGLELAEGMDTDAIARFVGVLKTPPVYNRQTVYGVIMIPEKQQLIPIT